jgi:hypothetical protein
MYTVMLCRYFIVERALSNQPCSFQFFEGIAMSTQGREAFQLPLSLIETLTAFAEGQKFPTTKSAVLRVGLEKFLTEEGYWPPASKRKEK